ncbi:hypothetical protein TNCV_306021 [Trichonephila clavipes]|nr:hypothetical protein TNCV_306021 [Trichonephila clavipes]
MLKRSSNERLESLEKYYKNHIEVDSKPEDYPFAGSKSWNEIFLVIDEHRKSSKPLASAECRSTIFVFSTPLSAGRSVALRSHTRTIQNGRRNLEPRTNETTTTPEHIYSPLQTSTSLQCDDSEPGRFNLHQPLYTVCLLRTQQKKTLATNDVIMTTQLSYPYGILEDGLICNTV